jgi:predicted nucleic acid-binding protein
MPDEPRRVYWDANVPLSYLNGVPDRVPILDELFRQARAGEIELVTSAISRVEIAFIQSERDAGTLDQETEDAIDALWSPGAPIKTVQFYDLIGDKARALMRQGISQGWGKLKPMDAIHLATAQQMAVTEFHTYDGQLHAWTNALGFPVTEPQTAQTVLGVEPPRS